MPSPFPGMNPYLENSELWPEVHHWLISAMGQTLAPQLRPKYRIVVEKRVYQSTRDENSLLIGIPDVTIQRRLNQSESIEGNIAIATPATQPITVRLPMPESVKQSYLEIREVQGGEVVTVIEVLSPSNKRAGEGREAYLLKRRRIFGSLTHLIEIDLLRSYEPMPFFSDEMQRAYRILVSRSERRPAADLYAFNLQETIPRFSLPLREGDCEPILDLQQLLNEIYDGIGYDLAINYAQDPLPALSEAEVSWLDRLLRNQNLRS